MAQHAAAVSTGSSAAIDNKKPPELPAGVEREARLLESLTEIPAIAAASCQPLPGGGLQLTVGVSPVQTRLSVQGIAPGHDNTRSETGPGVP